MGAKATHWVPEEYFDGPILSSTVKRLSVLIEWKDQGWGNRKGEIFVKLMRPSDSNPHSAVEVAMKHQLLGIAEHEMKSATSMLTEDPILQKSVPGDFYRFMRNVGGGGGHSLTVRNFKVVATLK